jgi:hypothetical protein
MSRERNPETISLRQNSIPHLQFVKHHIPSHTAVSNYI